MKIKVQGLVKRFGDFTALNDINFTVESGEFLAILGPSGCGKSTVLRLLAGLDNVTEGNIYFGDEEVTHLPPVKRNFSMVFQSYALFPHLSVYENIVFGLKMRSVPKSEIKKRLKETVDILGLEPFLNRKPAQLSGGQQQRVALGRAIISKRPVCFMDEPLSNLDAKLRHTMRRELGLLQKTLAKTMIYVTHDQVEAMTLADKVLLLNNGNFVQCGTPTELYKDPANVFTARFIGTPPMNILDIHESDMSTVFPGGNGKWHLGIRPEDIVIGGTGLRLEVRAVEYLGANYIVSCTYNGKEVIVVSKEPVQESGTITISWDESKVCIFDAQSGKRDVTMEQSYKKPRRSV